MTPSVKGALSNKLLTYIVLLLTLGGEDMSFKVHSLKKHPITDQTKVLIFFSYNTLYMTVKDYRKHTVNNRILFQLMDNPYFQTKVEGIKTNS